MDFVIKVLRFLKNKKPSFKELLNGALILESEHARGRTFDIRIISQSHIQLRLIILFWTISHEHLGADLVHTGVPRVDPMGSAAPAGIARTARTTLGQPCLRGADSFCPRLLFWWVSSEMCARRLLRNVDPV